VRRPRQPWVEGYARSLLGEPGPWADFGRDTVRDWLDLLAERQAAAFDGTGFDGTGFDGTGFDGTGFDGTGFDGTGPDSPGAEAERTLLLAVLRGALLDLLATGDTERVTRAVDRHLRAIDQPEARR
jgi:hypothetical protein